MLMKAAGAVNSASVLFTAAQVLQHFQLALAQVGHAAVGDHEMSFTIGDIGEIATNAGDRLVKDLRCLEVLDDSTIWVLQLTKEGAGSSWFVSELFLSGIEGSVHVLPELLHVHAIQNPCTRLNIRDKKYRIITIQYIISIIPHLYLKTMVGK